MDDLTFAPVSGRYIRMQGIKRTSSFGYSLRRLEVRAASSTTSLLRH
ncbi:hypothetical protein [Streptomyces sp. BE133]|nr:hypothetical protein [Streptomyces sp. BE133]MEE1808920.1 hypothetical protein [Streptomyces sp. BE133]